MWKPGQLVTIKGIVYRVKRAIPAYKACSLCGFNHCACTLFDAIGDDKPYPIAYNCYLKRLSPICGNQVR